MNLSQSEDQYTGNVSKYNQGNYDMCSSSPCIMIYKQGVEKSHITLEKATRKKP